MEHIACSCSVKRINRWAWHVNQCLAVSLQSCFLSLSQTLGSLRGGRINKNCSDSSFLGTCAEVFPISHYLIPRNEQTSKNCKCQKLDLTTCLTTQRQPYCWDVVVGTSVGKTPPTLGLLPPVKLFKQELTGLPGGKVLLPLPVLISPNTPPPHTHIHTYTMGKNEL